MIFPISIAVRAERGLMRAYYNGHIPYDHGELDWVRQHFQEHHRSGVMHITFPAWYSGDAQEIPATATSGVCWIQPKGEKAPRLESLPEICRMAGRKEIAYFCPPRLNRWISVDELVNTPH